MNRKILLLTCIAFFACNFLSANSRNEAFNIVQESVLSMDYQLIDEDNISIEADTIPLELCDTYSFTLSTVPGCLVSWVCSENMRIIESNYTGNATVLAGSLGDGWVTYTINCGGSISTHTYYFSISLPSPFPYHVFDNYSTTGNMNITYDCLIIDTFTINAGHTVDLYGDVFATYRAKIIVQPGANLYIHGATLTSYCDVMWGGIEVYGDYKSSPPVNGVVRVLDEATIDNAYTGIKAWDGGFVYTYGSVVNFINNETGIQINPLSEGRFNQIHFLIDTNYFGPLYRFNAHLMLLNGKRNEVVNCSFKNDIPLQYPYFPVPGENNNSGISVFDSGLIIEGNTYFSGLLTGIFAGNSGTMPEFKVAECIFINNVCGIHLNGLTGSIIYSNEFDLSYFDATGIFTYNSTDYTITENTFLNSSTPTQSTGVRIMDSGIEENQIYKNDFENLNVGIQAIGVNSNREVPTPQGLQFICNIFDNTHVTDVLVGYLPASPYFSYNNYVRPIQGSTVAAAGNEFSVTPSISNYSNDMMVYYHSGTPPSFAGTFVFPILSNPNPCPFLIVGKSMEQLEQYDLWNSEYEYWLALLLAFEGNNEEEYNKILNQVAHFSGLKNNYFNQIIAEALNKEPTEDEIENPTLRLKELRALFEYRGSYTDYLGITETYMAEKSYDNALSILANMYKLFELNEAQIGELKGLDTYISWRRKLDSEGNSIFALSSKEVDELVKYVETNTGRGTVFANNILCALYSICIEKETPKHSAPQNQINENSTQKSPMQIDAQALLDKISVIPNPTTGELRITNCELRINKIEILDLMGKTLSSNHLIISSSNPTIDISNLNSGIYFVKIVTEQGVTVKKVTKQ